MLSDLEELAHRGCDFGVCLIALRLAVDGRDTGSGMTCCLLTVEGCKVSHGLKLSTQLYPYLFIHGLKRTNKPPSTVPWRTGTAGRLVQKRLGNAQGCHWVAISLSAAHSI